MVDWEVTATTIYCDAVDDEVTLIIYKDLSTKCTGYSEYGKPGKEILSLLKKKGKQLGRHLECTGPECYHLIQYKEKLLDEETKKRR